MVRYPKENGLYVIGGNKYHKLEGSRAEVMHDRIDGTRSAYRTKGGLTRNDLIYNSQGRIVSKKKSKQAKKEDRLGKHNYTAKKGHFGPVRIKDHKKKTAKRGRKSRKSRK